jgi:hypothetical protein
MSVKIVRLINNEEVIGKVQEKKNSVTIENGAVIVPVGEGRMAMVPWLPHAKESKVELNSDKILFTFEPIVELANEYSSRMGSGLVMPTPGKLPTPDLSGLRLTED